MTTFHQRVRMWMLIGMLLITSLLTYCHPAHAGAHGSYPGMGGEAYTYPKDFPLDTPRDSYETNSTTAGVPKFSVRIEPRDTHYADVIFHNELTRAYYVHNTINFIREDDGIVITVIFNMGDGDEPDIMTVIPPPGYVAIPAEVSVEEGADGIIEIHEATLG